MFCKYCGKELLDSDKFCPFCGKSVTKANNQDNQSQEQYQNTNPNVNPNYNYNNQNYNNQGFVKFEDQTKYNVPYYVNQQQIQNPDDSGSVGWGFLGFFIPLCGLILFIVWNKSKPKNAKNAGIGALIAVCLQVLVFILFLGLAAAVIGY